MTLIFEMAFAFSLGALSVLTPCVLPIIPGYLAYLFGREKYDVVRGAVSIYAGISLGAILVGLIMAVAGQAGRWFYAAAAALLFVFLLDTVGFTILRPITFGGVLNRRRGILAGFGFGLMIIFVASPCVVPLLAITAIFAMTLSDAATRVLLMFSYAAGLGMPFMLIGGLSVKGGQLAKIANARGVRWIQTAVLIATIAWLLWSFAKG